MPQATKQPPDAPPSGKRAAPRADRRRVAAPGRSARRDQVRAGRHRRRARRRGACLDGRDVEARLPARAQWPGRAHEERSRPALHRFDTDRGRPAHAPPRSLPPHRVACEPARQPHADRARRGGSGGGAACAPPRARRGPRVTKAARRTFHSLRYRNYRLFFGGQIVSQTGSWMQRIALGWYILQLTHSPFDVGVMAFAQFLPYMAFGLFAGVLTDRLDARRTVIATQVAQLVSASALAWISLGCFSEPWMLYTIAFINGTVLVLDVPSRQQLTYRMVGREDLPNAIALNSTLFNASRIFGPAIAGVILVAGAGVCFLTNAISYLAVLLCLLAMRVSEFFPLQEFERPRILDGTREGLAWIRRQPRMLILLSLVFVISTFCFNFNVTLPVLAKVTLNGHAYVYGLLSAAFGVGALVGALAAASLGRASMKALLIGGLVFAGAELLLAPVRSALLAGVLLFFVGAGFTAWSANSNAIMQLAAPDHLRGRVIGLYFYAFNGTGAVAGILTGALCDVGGTELAFVVAGVVGIVAVFATALSLGWTPRITTRRRADQPQHA